MTHADYLALLERYWQRWPDLRRYEATARLTQERFNIGGEYRGGLHVTVTCFDKRNERDAAATQAAQRRE